MRDAGATRLRIQQAALHLFVERGVDGTTTRDLAQAAGLAEGTLYRHYVSKDALVQDLFLSHYAAFARRLAALRDGCRGLRARLEAIVAEACRFYDEDPVLFRFLLLVQHQALPRVGPDGDNPVQVIQDIIAEGIAAGEIPPQPPELATAMVLGLILQPAVILVYGRLAPPFGQYAETIAAACWRALSPPALSPRESRHG